MFNLPTYKFPRFFCFLAKIMYSLEVSFTTTLGTIAHATDTIRSWCNDLYRVKSGASETTTTKRHMILAQKAEKR